jgi:hypothetical protein
MVIGNSVFVLQQHCFPDAERQDDDGCFGYAYAYICQLTHTAIYECSTKHGTDRLGSIDGGKLKVATL